jgi:hypothetical protein
VLGIHGDGDLLPHLGTHLKVFGNLLQIPQKLVRRGRSVKTGINANGPEERLAFVEVLAKLAKGLSCKGRGGIFAAIDSSLPAFIGPGRGAEAHEIREGCGGRGTLGHLFSTVEG